MANDYVGWGLVLGIEEGLDEFINDATGVVNSLGTGIPPRDLVAFSSESTEDGVKLTFTPPGATYLPEHTASDGKQFACMPAGVLIRYSDTGYPRTPDEGKFGYDYKPTGDWVTTSQECTVVGLNRDTKYYFTAFPYSTEHVYNKNQVTANRTEMTWVGNKGTISVTVNTPEGYEGTMGEYTITLVDQASDSPQNIEKTATGAGLTQFGGLTAGKSYKVRLSNTTDLQAPPDSEVITVVGGVNYDVTMTYALMYGTITVNVSTQPAGMPIGRYTVTLTPNDSTGALSQQGNNSQAVVFNNVKNGVVYTVGLSAINHYTANAGGTVTAVGGQNISHNAHYAWSSTLEKCDWNTIKSLAIANVASTLWAVGDTKTVTTNGETLTMEIIGFNHDSSRSITFGTKNLMESTTVFMGYGHGDTDTPTVDGWKQSALYEKLNGDVYNGFPSDLKSAIKNVSKRCSYVDMDGFYDDPGYTQDYVSCKVFTFSVTELFGNVSGPYGVKIPVDGTQYARFTDNASRAKKLSNGSGAATSYWLRTPKLMSWDYFQAVASNGSLSGMGGSCDSAHLSYLGVAFGFCV